MNEWLAKAIAQAEVYRALVYPTPGQRKLIALADEVKRLSRPAYEREPPHCPTCDCGMQSPGANVADPIPGWVPSSAVTRALNDLIMVAGPHRNGDTALYWHLVATLEAHRAK